MVNSAPTCLYCGYNLTGLPEETRCPECGMISVPEALRREVWDTVDSRRRLWALMARLVAKHPPGWWWALDRPGDVRRSLGVLIRNLAISLLIAFLSTVSAASIDLQETRTTQWYDQADPQAEALAWHTSVLLHGFFGSTGEVGSSSMGPVPPQEVRQQARSPAMRVIVSRRVVWYWDSEGLWIGAGLFTWLFLVWAYVAQVGLWTQIRKGMPEFAKPPRTIVAAANYQSCKLVFLATFVALGCATETAVRCVTIGRGSGGYDWGLLMVGAGLVTAAGTLWVGAIRSDFTHQLIRSPIHAARIVLMYVITLPLLTVPALAAVVRTIVSA